MNYNPGTEEIRADIEEKLSRLFGETPADASREQLYRAVAGTVREILVDKRARTKEKIVATQSKQTGFMNSTPTPDSATEASDGLPPALPTRWHPSDIPHAVFRSATNSVFSDRR